MAKPERRKSGGTVTQECIQELLDFFIKNAYRAKNVDQRYEIIHKRCIHLVGRDYRIEVIDNKAGQLCSHYPSELVVIEGHLGHARGHQHLPTRVNSAVKLKELIATARFARCRSRFVMPVILYENKNICRSATLSTMAELYGRSGVDWIFTGGESAVGGTSNVAIGGATASIQAADTCGVQKQTCVPPVTVAMVGDVPGGGPPLNESTSSTRNTPSGSAPAGSTNDSYVIVTEYSLCQSWMEMYPTECHNPLVL